jgi:hypothetical protein
MFFKEFDIGLKKPNHFGGKQVNCRPVDEPMPIKAPGLCDKRTDQSTKYQKKR